MGGCTGGGGGANHTCLLLSDFGLYLHAQLEGSFLSCQLLLVWAQATSLIQRDLKCASEDEKQCQYGTKREDGEKECLKKGH